jgi:hypothetical protein
VDALEVGQTTEERLGPAGRRELDPVVTRRVGAVAALAVVDVPAAEDEVEFLVHARECAREHRQCVVHTFLTVL